MENLKLFLTGGAIALILFSCKQENEIKLTKTDPIEQQIIAFKDKLESNLKSGELLESDSAVWYIEAALNYTYCEPHNSNTIKVDSVFVTVPASETDEINFNDVINAYNDLNSGMNNIFNQTIGVNKKIQLVDVSIVENKSKRDDITFKLVTIISEFHPKIPTPFMPNDYWYPIWESGQCGDYEGLGEGLDGGKLIAQHAATYIGHPFEPGYVTDVNILNFSVVDYPEYLWEESLSHYTDACLSPDEMQFWTNRLVQLGNNNTIPGKILVGYQIDGDVTGNIGSTYLYSHYASISYGIWHSNDEEEF